jgi:hypothetical protein
MAEREKCLCCGYYTLPTGKSENLFNHGFICPVCFWENDTLIDNEQYSVLNHLTLNHAKANYIKFGACSKTMLQHVRKPTDDEK